MITQNIPNDRLTPMIHQHFAASNAIEDALCKLRACKPSNLPSIEADLMQVNANLTANLRDLWNERAMRESCK